MVASTISFSSPSSSPQSPPPPQPPRATPAELEAVRLRRLSDNLERLLDPAFLDCADAEIALAAGKGGAAVGVHRCILAAKSAFFLDHFASLPPPAAVGERPRLELNRRQWWPVVAGLIPQPRRSLAAGWERQSKSAGRDACRARWRVCSLSIHCERGIGDSERDTEPSKMKRLLNSDF